MEQGGYFVSIDLVDGCAAEVVRLAGEVGVKLTPASATYPLGRDPTYQPVGLNGGLGSGGDEIGTGQFLPLLDPKAGVAPKRSFCAAAIGSNVAFLTINGRWPSPPRMAVYGRFPPFGSQNARGPGWVS